MNKFLELDSTLRNQSAAAAKIDSGAATDFARAIASIENALVVVSDLRENSSMIFPGEFARTLGLDNYNRENSIWETEILRLLPREERDAKFLAELKFFHFINRVAHSEKTHFYLRTLLNMTLPGGKTIAVLHKMYYYYADDRGTVAYAICTYQPLTQEMKTRSEIVNSVTGKVTPLFSEEIAGILSRREREVLSLIRKGLTSAEIAEALFISKHTVSRHRQDIIERLQVRNTAEALRVADALHLL